MSTTEELNEFGKEHGLVAMLVQSSLEQYGTTSQQLIDSLQRQVNELIAERDCIRDNVLRLVNSPVLVNPDRYVTALYPLSEQIKHYAAGQQETD